MAEQGDALFHADVRPRPPLTKRISLAQKLLWISNLGNYLRTHLLASAATVTSIELAQDLPLLLVSRRQIQLYILEKDGSER